MTCTHFERLASCGRIVAAGAGTGVPGGPGGKAGARGGVLVAGGCIVGLGGACTSL